MMMLMVYAPVIVYADAYSDCEVHVTLENVANRASDDARVYRLVFEVTGPETGGFMAFETVLSFDFGRIKPVGISGAYADQTVFSGAGFAQTGASIRRFDADVFPTHSIVWNDTQVKDGEGRIAFRYEMGVSDPVWEGVLDNTPTNLFAFYFRMADGGYADTSSFRFEDADLPGNLAVPSPIGTNIGICIGARYGVPSVWGGYNLAAGTLIIPDDNITVPPPWPWPQPDPFIEKRIDTDKSIVIAPEDPVPAQPEPIDGNGDGQVFKLVLIHNGNGFPDKFYTASSRYPVDYLFYQTVSGDWILIGDGPAQYHIISIPEMTVPIEGTDTTRELNLKVVSKNAGVSNIAFGVDDECIVNFVLSRELPDDHDATHIIGHQSFTIEFTSSPAAQVDLLIQGYELGEPIVDGVRTVLPPYQKIGGTYLLVATVTTSASIPVSGKEVVFSIFDDAGELLYSASVHTNVAGRANHEFSSGLPGTYEVLASIDGVPEQEPPVGNGYRTDRTRVVFEDYGTTLSIVIENDPACAGDIVLIPVIVYNNPGLSDVNLVFEYDSDLILLDFFTDETTMGLDPVSNAEYNTVLLSDSTIEGYTGDTLVYLKFEVKTNATLGQKQILISQDDSGVSDKDGQMLSFIIAPGYVNVAEKIHGDVNCDGKVLLNDLTVLRRHFANWPKIMIKGGADVNGDGYVLLNDLTILRRYFANWPGIVLGPTDDTTAIAAAFDTFFMTEEIAEPSDGVVITVDTVKGERGKTVDVPVSIDNNPGLSDAQLEFQFDGDLRLVGFITDDSTMTLDNTSNVEYKTALLTDSTTGGFTGIKLVTLRFFVSETASIGTKRITIVDPALVDKDADNVYPMIVPGGIIIETEEPTPKLERIEVTKEPTKTEYFVGDRLDLTDMEVTAYYSDGSSKEVSGYTTDPAHDEELNVAGTQEVTVIYSEDDITKTDSFSIIVNPITLESIKVTKEPTKTEYFVGDRLDLTSMEVTAYYSDGSSKEVSGYTTDPVDGTKLNDVGKQNVTVSYEGETDEFGIEVFPIPRALVTAAPINGVISPVAGMAASTVISDGTDYKAALSWDGNTVSFGFDTVYTATITLTAAEGYTFAGGFSDTAALAGFTVNGIAPSAWVSNDGEILVFSVTFPKTGPVPGQIVTFADPGPINKTYGDGNFTNAATSTAADAVIRYSSCAPTIAEVDAESGQVTIKKAGTATITAYAEETPGEFADGLGSYELIVDKKPLADEMIGVITDKPYNGGEPVEPVPDVTDPAGITSGDYTVSYENNTDAGTAVVKITATEDGNYVGYVSKEFIITKIDYIGPTNGVSSAKYGAAGSFDLATLGLPPGYTLGKAEVKSDSSSIIEGSPSIVDSTLYYRIVYDETLVGETAVITVPVNSTNYNEFNIEITITVQDKEIQPEFRFLITERTAVYGDLPFTESAIGQEAGSVVTYVSSNPDVATVDRATGQVTIWKTGYAIITATASETDDYSETPASYALTVDKKTVIVSAGTYTISKTYDGTTGAGAATGDLQAIGILTGDDVTVMLGTIPAYSNANAHSGTIVLSISLSGADSENYTLSSTTTVSVPAGITQKELIGGPTITVTGSYTYTGTAITPVFSVKDSDMELADADYTAIVTNNIIAGPNAAITVIANTDGNYSWAPVVIQYFTIEKAFYNGTKTATSSAKYGNTGSINLASLLPDGATVGTPVVEADASSILTAGSLGLSGTILSYALANDASLVGKTAEIQVPVTNATNYESFDITVTVSVTNKLPQIGFGFAVDAQTKTYGDAPFTVVATGQVAGSTVTYASSNPAVATVDGSTGQVTIRKADSATITATASETGDYSAAYASYLLTVNKAALTVKPGNYTINRNAAMPTPEVEYIGLKGGDIGAEVATLVSGSLDMEIRNAANTGPLTSTSVTGTFRIVFRDSPVFNDADNYTITVEEGSLTVRAIVTDEEEVIVVGPGTGGGGGGGGVPDPASGADETINIFDDKAPTTFLTPFIDVDPDDWFTEAIWYVYDNKLMVGTSTEPMLFSPNVATTRGMIVTVLYRLAGSPDVSDLSNPFDDVAETAWYYAAIKWAAANGIVAGYGNGKYGPEDNITREQLATILNNYAVQTGKDLPAKRDYSGFNDEADIANYAKEAVERFFKAMIVNGKPGNLFDPKGEATRAEFAAILMGFIETIIVE